MKSQREQSPEDIPVTRFEALFAALPPLGSPDYLEYVSTAPPDALPAQVLVRAYRQLCGAKREDAMRVTLNRLFIPANLRRIRRLAKQKVPAQQASHDADDLVQAALTEIVEVLPTERGALAETAWVLFCEQRFADAWRKLFGRDGSKLKIKVGSKRVPITYAKPTPNSVGGSYEGSETEEQPDDPVEATDGSSAPWHSGFKESDLPAVESIIGEIIASLPDPVMRHVAEDQWGDDQSSIFSGTSEGGKPPLTEQTGLSRHQLTRLLKNLRARLAGALLANANIKVDTEWLRQFVRGERSKTSNRARRQAR
jgi:DNA-directed RNA polymerase specialized sigma24 family protein